MKISEIRQALGKIFRWGMVLFLKRLQGVALVLCCFSLIFLPDNSFSGELLTEPFPRKGGADGFPAAMQRPVRTQVKDEETQLAKRFAVRESVESPFEYSLSVGYRNDNFNWSIADGGVNVASEVSWMKTVIAQLRAAAKLNLGSDWMVRGIYTTGAVKSGSNRDSRAHGRAAWRPAEMTSDFKAIPPLFAMNASKSGDASHLPRCEIYHPVFAFRQEQAVKRIIRT